MHPLPSLYLPQILDIFSNQNGKRPTEFPFESHRLSIVSCQILPYWYRMFNQNNPLPLPSLPPHLSLPSLPSLSLLPPPALPPSSLSPSSPLTHSRHSDSLYSSRSLPSPSTPLLPPANLMMWLCSCVLVCLCYILLYRNQLGKVYCCINYLPEYVLLSLGLHFQCAGCSDCPAPWNPLTQLPSLEKKQNFARD
jgi:hypothetical protein